MPKPKKKADPSLVRKCVSMEGDLYRRAILKAEEDARRVGLPVHGAFSRMVQRVLRNDLVAGGGK